MRVMMMKEKTLQTHRIIISTLVIFLLLIACGEKEKIVEVEGDCFPEAPRDVWALNLPDRVTINWWHPDPDNDITSFLVYRSEYIDTGYARIGTVSRGDFPPDTYDFLYDDFNVSFNKQYFYEVRAVNAAGRVSAPSYEGVSGTPRPEFFVRLYSLDFDPDSSGYDFTSFGSHAQMYTLESTDIYINNAHGYLEIVARGPRVKIQDYGFVFSFDDINYAPEFGWSVNGSVEAVEEHCYMLRLGEADGVHYAKMYLWEVAATYVEFWCAYQTSAENRDLAPPRPGGYNDRAFVRASLKRGAQ